MNWGHLRAFVWLRWRLLVNQWRRAGILSGVLLGVLSVGLFLLAILIFGGALALGWNTIPEAAPKHLMYVWDGIVAVFLFFWCVGLMMEIQRSEPMLLSRFLHLPVSVKEAFLINYLSSLACPSLLLFIAAGLGYAIALVAVMGLAMLPVLGLLAAFVLMTTALTYQLQGFLAALMTNPRKRRSVIVGATVIFILIVQVPNLMNGFFFQSNTPLAPEETAKATAELEKIRAIRPTNAREAEELLRRQSEILEQKQEALNADLRRRSHGAEATARLANIVLPVGWLPYGTMAAAEGRSVPWILGLLGMTLVGAGSLARGYRKTIAQFQGRSGSRGPLTIEPATAQAKAQSAPAPARGKRALFLERSIPGCSDPVSAVALAGIRSLARSPEAKLMLLGPIFTIVILGSMIAKGQAMADWLRPLAVAGAVTFTLLSVLQTMGNQFGLDRDGFRIFVLSALPRRDLLFGKNLVYAPFALGMAAITLIMFQAANPLRWDQLLASVALSLAMFLVFCMGLNLISILTPLRIEPNSLKPTNIKLSVGLAQFALTVTLIVLVLALAASPFLLELLLNLTGGTWGLPMALLTAIVESVVIVVLYRFTLGWLGGMLMAREQRILEIVTNRGKTG